MQATDTIQDFGAAPNTSALRNFVQKAGLLTTIRNLRGKLRRDVAHWVDKGCPSPAPNVVKMATVRAYVRDHGTKVFIETGTFLGSMVDHIAATGVQCHTIEIVPEIHERAKKVLSRRHNIDLVLGDSAVELPRLLATLDEPATFWLDGHYSGGFTGKSEVDTPISAELDMVLNHPIKRHVILIDDARCFTAEDNYPHLSQLLAIFDDHPHYRAWVSADIIRIVPRD